MKAWRLSSPGHPLELVELPDPVARAGWVVLDVEAAGLCHSDVSIVDGAGARWIDKTPLTLGHEVAGTIVECGEGVSGFAVGDRVGVAQLSQPADQEAAGYIRSAPGISVDGGYAERCLVHQSTLVPIPGAVSFAAAAVATDAIATACHAVRRAGAVSAGEVVGIIGLGGLGLSGVRGAVLAGATVYGVDIRPEVFAAALEAGARECFTDVRELGALRPHMIIDFAGVGTSTSAALRAVRPGGRVVVVGLGARETTVRTHDLVTRFKTLRGSLGATKQDLREVYALLAGGEMTPLIEEAPFDDLNAALDRLRRGEVRGRLVTRPG